MNSSTKWTDSELESLEMKVCPYNRNHVLKNSKYQIHINNCLRNMNESDRQKWKTCPFDENHRIFFDSFMAHIIECDSNHIYRQYSQLKNALKNGIH
jgi:hypothetical protein